MKHTILLLAFFLSSCLLQAQTDFKPGYVIKAVGDTLFGEVDYRGDKLMGEVCKFRHNKKDTVLQFTPYDIYGYRFPDSKYYISKEVDGKKVFLEFLIKGRFNMYYIRNENGDHYYFDKEGVALTELPYEEEYRTKGEKNYLYKSNKHIGLLNFYMQDAVGLESEINSLKKPDHKKLIKLAEDYHNVVCEGDKCIIYEKKLPPVMVNPEIIGGYVLNSHPNYLNYSTDWQPNNIQTGVLAHLWLPRVNENFYLRTGILFTNFKFYENNVFYFKIPLQIEYQYPKGMIRPRIALGTYLLYPALAFSSGINIKLSKSVFWSINYDADFMPNVVLGISEQPLSLKYSSGYFSSGIYFKF